MNAFYNQYATCLDDAMTGGCDSIFALAEHFGVNEDFMRKSVCYYTYGNLDDADYLPM